MTLIHSLSSCGQDQWSLGGPGPVLRSLWSALTAHSQHRHSTSNTTMIWRQAPGILTNSFAGRKQWHWCVLSEFRTLVKSCDMWSWSLLAESWLLDTCYPHYWVTDDGSERWVLWLRCHCIIIQGSRSHDWILFTICRSESRSPSEYSGVQSSGDTILTLFISA